MSICTPEPLYFPGFNRRKIECRFEGGEVSSDGGAMLLRAADRKLGLVEALDRVITDPRDADQVKHSQLSLLRQRIYGIGAGYEDLNDHNSLREDLAWQTAVERDERLASASTLCRLEGRADRKMAVEMQEVFVDQFIASFRKPPREVVLDFDATDDRVHGGQEGRAFHGYYRDWCFLPLYVFCGEQLLVSYLRPSNIDPAKHAWAILALLFKRLRAVWPQVKIIFRADSGFCRWRMLRWCERVGMSYVVGLAKNKRLLAQSQAEIEAARDAFETSGQKVRRFSRLEYAARSWDRPREVILKAEHGSKGANPRYVLTNLGGDPQYLYDKIYCARGEMENRIKEQQLGLFADRTSATAWWANQLRLLLSSAAYLLIEAIRRLGLRGTELARAQVGTIRLKLLKIGAVLTRNTRRVKLLLSSSYPYQSIFRTVFERLSSA